MLHKNKLFKIGIFLLCCMLALFLCACRYADPGAKPTGETVPSAAPIPGQPTEPAVGRGNEGTLIGISVSEPNDQSWIGRMDFARSLQQRLTERGYEVMLEQAAHDASQQYAQIEDLLERGAKLIIVDARLYNSVNERFPKAQENNVPFIAFDKFFCSITTADVAVFAGYDYHRIGVEQGRFIEEQLRLEEGGGPYNIEFVAGDPADMKSFEIYSGAMEVLRPYLEKRVLVSLSGQTEMMDAATELWLPENAQERMGSILTKYYANQPLHAVLASNDSVAQGAIAALESAYSGDVSPIVTGSYCGAECIWNTLEGRQAMTVVMDPRDLAERIVRMTDELMQGKEPEINDTEKSFYTSDTETLSLPAFLVAPRVCTKEDLAETLMASGLCTPEELER